ncbi:MAG: glycosyltransferase [Calditrichaeota bacterium]|nr:glycosyltransferase [Calditrichota bacterium]
MDLSIIIVNYNVKEFLQQAVTSIRQAGRSLDCEVIVVDNASADGSVELVREKFPDVKLIANAENRGFAVANNQAMKIARGDFILLLNPDTIVQENTFSVIVDYFRQHPDCGMVGCKILNPDGSLQLACRRSFPTPWVALTKIVGLSRLFPRSKLFGKYNLTYLDPNENYEVEAISGSFMFFRREVMEQIGYLDESFFMYGEDLDWCFRVREAGWKIYYLPDTQIIHFKGESSKKSDTDLILQFYRAMKLFVEKHYQNRYFHVPQWLLMAGISARALLTFVSRLINYLLPGIIDWLLLNLSLALAIFVGIYLRFQFFPLQAYLPVMMVYSLIWIFCLILSDAYYHSKFSSLRAAQGVLLGLIFNASLTFFFNQYAFSRAVVLSASVFSVVTLAGWRFAVKLLARFKKLPFLGSLGNALLGRKAIIVAVPEDGTAIAEKLRQSVDAGYDILGLVTPTQQAPGDSSRQLTMLGALENLDSIISRTGAREIIFATEGVSFDKILHIISRTSRKDVTFKLVPRSMDVIIGKASIEYIGDLPLVDIQYRLSQPRNRIAKRIFDIFVAVALLIVFLPVFFYLIVFKGARCEKKIIVGPLEKNIPVCFFKGKKLTERQKKLPLLGAVLLGRISLVGAPFVFLNENKNFQAADLKPGVTGLAQISRNTSGTAEDIERYNQFYMKNYSIQSDVEILIKALFRI